MALINTDLLNRFWKNGIIPIKTKLSQLDTTVVSWRSEIDVLSTNVELLKKSVSDGKQSVANAITGQGVNTAADATFGTMANNIKTVGTNKYNAGYSSGYSSGTNDTKKGTAVAANVLAGKTFTSSSGVNITGTLANCGQYQYAGGVGNGFSVPEDAESEYIALNKIPEGAYFANGADWAPEVRIRRQVLEDYMGWDQHYDDGYNAGYVAGSSSGTLVDLPIGVTIQYREGSHGEIHQYFNIEPFKRLGYKTVTWETNGANYVIAVKENAASGASIDGKSYHTKNGSTHAINLKDSSCPDVLYVYPDTSSAYENTITFTFKA